MPRQLTTVLACIAIAPGAALLSGCGDDDADSGTQAPAPPGAGATSEDTVQVVMKNILNMPKEVTVELGQTVRWRNTDGFPHTATATKGADFDSGNIESGNTYDYKPTRAGTIDYVCSIHPNQTGTITVAE